MYHRLIKFRDSLVIIECPIEHNELGVYVWPRMGNKFWQGISYLRLDLQHFSHLEIVHMYR